MWHTYSVQGPVAGFRQLPSQQFYNLWNIPAKHSSLVQFFFLWYLLCDAGDMRLKLRCFDPRRWYTAEHFGKVPVVAACVGWYLAGASSNPNLFNLFLIFFFTIQMCPKHYV